MLFRSQWDKRWGYLTYSDGPICSNGCGPTALSMVIVGLTGRTDANPYMVANFAVLNNYYVNEVGTAWSLMSEGAKEFGLSVREVPLHEQSMKAALLDGELIIMSVGEGTFTTFRHFIVITGVDESNGEFIVNDPNSYIKSAQTYSYEIFEAEARNIWAFSL